MPEIVLKNCTRYCNAERLGKADEGIECHCGCSACYLEGCKDGSIVKEYRSGLMD
jgi:hypothetical protein